jgi:transposase
VIRIDAAWFAVEPLDMRAGVDKALARVVNVFGEARAHHAYLFINKRANRMKVLVHDGFGLRISRKEGQRFKARRSMVSRHVGPVLVKQDVVDFL